MQKQDPCKSASEEHDHVMIIRLVLVMVLCLKVFEFTATVENHDAQRLRGKTMTQGVFMLERVWYEKVQAIAFIIT